MDDSFSKILDEAFREGDIFDIDTLEGAFWVILASEYCAPSVRLIDEIRTRDIEVPILVISEDESDDWIEGLPFPFRQAPSDVRSTVLSEISVPLTPTLIEVGFRTVIGFHLGHTGILRAIDAV